MGFLSLLLSLKSQRIIRLSCFPPPTVRLSVQKALGLCKISEASLEKVSSLQHRCVRKLIWSEKKILVKMPVNICYVAELTVEGLKMLELKPENPKHKPNSVIWLYGCALVCGFLIFIMFIF